MKVLLVGISGFPFGMAAVEKQKLIAKALLLNDDVSVEIICNNNLSQFAIKKKGEYQGIKFRYTTLFLKQGKNALLRRINLYYGKINELGYLLTSRYDYIIVSSRDFFQIFSYKIIAKIKNVKIVLTAVEDKAIMPSYTFFGKIDNFLYQKYVWRLVDGAFPISEELKNQIKNINSDLPQLKIPVLVNMFSFKQRVSSPVNFPYFLFCGAANYFDTIKFIIDSYCKALTKSKLILIINGSNNQLNKISNYINNVPNNGNIYIKSKLTYNSLITYYKNATALLIPLNFNQQDKARFPHKIGEYCASRRPIISSEWGEIQYYFSNKINALLLPNNDKLLFAKYLKEIEMNKKLASTISENAYRTAQVYFDYKKYGNKISLFLKDLIKI